MREPGKVAVTIYIVFLFIEYQINRCDHEVRTYTSRGDVCGRGVAPASRG